MQMSTKEIRMPNEQEIMDKLFAAIKTKQLTSTMIEEIKNHKDIIDKKNSDDQTLLILATNDDLIDCVQTLIAANANINLVDSSGQTALFYAAWQGHAHCLKLL